MKSLNAAAANDDYYRTSHSNLESSAGRGTRTSEAGDEMSHDLTDLARDAPLDGGESTFAGGYSTLGARSPSPGTAQSADSAELARTAAELAAGQRQLLDALDGDNVEPVDRPLRQLG